MKRVGIFLITVALIYGMVGCAPTPVQYALTISSTEGGSVAYPGEGTFIYNAGEVVNLAAIPEGGYYFIDWGGDVTTIVEPHSAYTIITMNDHYSVTARFLQGQPIWDWWDLYEIRHSVGGSYLLMNNLDATTYGYDELANETANQGKCWQPIGTGVYPFTGTFDGQGYEISDLFINRPDESVVGLFGVIGKGGVIENIGVVNATVTGNEYVGGLVGYTRGTMSDCYATGNVTGNRYVGGLAGDNRDGTVSDCYANGSVTGNSNVGGLVGYNRGTMSDCYATGNVTGSSRIGGLIGLNQDGSISDSFSTGDATGSITSVGGLVGCSNNGSVTHSYSIGSVTGSEWVGGLIGYKNEVCVVSECFWDIETSGQATSEGGTGKTTVEMQDIDTFSAATWGIVAVANPDTRNLSYIWNIVDDETYPFLSWESIS